MAVKQRAEKRRIELKDVKEPVLFRDIFPYTSIPRVVLEDRLIQTKIPKDIWITDTTFRDGQQSRPPYKPQQIADIFDFLHRMSGPKGVIRQSEFFLYSEKDREAVRLCMEKGYRFPEITGWIRANKNDFKLLKDVGITETGILTSCSDYHIFLKLNLSRKEALKSYLDIVKTAIEHGIKPRCHFEDITRADFYGFVIPFAQELMKISEDAKVPVKIRACDTMGYGIPFPGTALPRSVPEIFYALNREAGVPSEQLEWHGHNDFHKGLINGVAAWMYGCSSVNGALLGFGERTGNTPVEALLIEYISLTGESTGIDTAAITEMSAYFRQEMDFPIPANYPFVGAEFNSTSAGIHADGMMKNEEIYNIFDTSKILNRPMGVIVTDKTGIAGIAHWVNNHLNQKADMKIDKRHPGLAKIYKWVMDQYNQGRTTSISHNELIEHAKKYLPEYFVSDLDKLKIKAREIALHLVEGTVQRPDFRTMNHAKQETIMQKLLDEHPFIQFAYVVNPEGKKTTRNITQIQFKAQLEHADLGDNFSDRSWFIRPMSDGKSFVSDFYTSKITGALCITVSAPISSEQGGIEGVFGVDIRFEDLVKSE